MKIRRVKTMADIKAAKADPDIRIVFRGKDHIPYIAFLDASEEMGISATELGRAIILNWTGKYNDADIVAREAMKTAVVQRLHGIIQLELFPPRIVAKSKAKKGGHRNFLRKSEYSAKPVRTRKGKTKNKTKGKK